MRCSGSAGASGPERALKQALKMDDPPLWLLGDATVEGLKLIYSHYRQNTRTDVVPPAKPCDDGGGAWWISV